MARPRNSATTLATRRAILDEAEAAFARAGQAARLADISAGAGITRPSLLYHFSSKEALHTAVVVRTFTELSEALLRGRSVEGDFPTQLRGMVLAFERWLVERPSAARIIVQEMIAESGPGQDLLMAQASPVLDGVEQWLSTAGATHLRPGLPVRSAILQVASDVLLRHASGPLGGRLWRDHNDEQTWTLVRSNILE